MMLFSWPSVGGCLTSSQAGWRTRPAAVARLLVAVLVTILSGGQASAQPLLPSSHSAAPLALAKRYVAQRARAVVLALKNNDVKALASYVHPGRGVRFSPYGFGVEERVWWPRQVAALGQNAHTYDWGRAATSGKPLRLTWQEYRRRFIYNGNFAATREVRLHSLQEQPFNQPELNSTYAGGLVVEYHLPGHRTLKWRDARSLWMVWQPSGGVWYLTAVANQTAGVNYIAQQADAQSRWDTLAFILTLFAAVLFVPVGVDQVVARRPYVTQSLIAINVLVFCLTVVVANLYLPQDRIAGQHLLALHPSYGEAQGAAVAMEHAHNSQEFTQAWQMQHAASDYVLEPHYSALNHFAYRPAEPSLSQKLIGLFGSMFLHGSLLHLAGNMIFLWVFGRALEEKFGSGKYLLVYLLSGLCGTLAYHATTAYLMPAALGLPALGASGAIAGLLGAFMWRFRRTPVKVFCVPPMSWPLLALAGALWAAIGYFLFGPAGARVMFGLAIAGCLWFGPGLFWHIYTVAAGWAIGVWLLVFNFAPGVWSVLAGHPSGVAHWAHIGGFFAGMLLVAIFKPQSKEAAQAEARVAFSSDDARRAALYAAKLLLRDAHNPRLDTLRAYAYERLDDEVKARDSYLNAISLYFANSDYGRAARAYLEAKRQHPDLVLPPAEQAALGHQMVAGQGVADHKWRNAVTYGEASGVASNSSHAEASLVSSARLYLHRVQEPQIAADLLQMLLQQYPDTSWSNQAQYLLHSALAARKDAHLVH